MVEAAESTAESTVESSRVVTAADHPLAPLSRAEIETAVAIVRHEGLVTESSLFAYIGLYEPDKATVRGFRPGDPVERRVRMVVVPGPEASTIEGVISLAGGTGEGGSGDGGSGEGGTGDGGAGAVERWETVDDVRPALLIVESIGAINALRADPRWQEAMRRRGIEDLDQVQIDPWPAGTFGLDHETNRRISRCLFYYREHPGDNGYARPIEGVTGFVDMGRGEVLEVVDTGVIPLPPEKGSYFPEDHEPLRSDLKPLHISQPDGPSFSIEGNLVRWQRWSFRVSMDPYEGIVLHTLGYDDGGQTRPVLYRASVSEMVVPYGSPDPNHAWKSAFDAGEWGLGRMANSLTLGCDCLGEIHYFDCHYADELGRPHTLKRGICMHEEDYGILWKHADLLANRIDVRRSRRLVISSIATVGNYEYGFYWYLYLDGTIQLEVKLTGVMSTMAIAGNDAPAHTTLVAPGLAAPFHQHLFNARLDVEVDGPANTVYEVETHPVPSGGTDNPWGNVFDASVTPLRTELAAQRTVNAATSRRWKIVNDQARNRLGQPTAYALVPGSTPTLLADPESSVGRRAGFATRNLWVTPYSPDERRAAGNYPNQHAGGDGLPRWTAGDRSIEDEDLVVWYTFGVTHVPRPEDWPVMPVEYTGFSLLPTGFFGENPALDLPG